MAKTRSQTGNRAIKKEEEEEDCKDNLLWHSASNTTKKSAKITTLKPSKNKSRNLPDQQVKIEQDTDIKLLLKPTANHSRQHISQEQINQLIDYVVNHGMSIHKASCRVNMSRNAANYYYDSYRNDPEKKIPSAPSHLRRAYTQQQIENLIRYIVDDKMTVKEASTKANMYYASGFHYYNKYLKDPDHNVPIPFPRQNYTQDQKNKLIGYIVNDKMSITAASKKAIMGADAGLRYYHKYIDDGHAAPSHIISPNHYTQEQINELIRYIVDDKMTIRAASRKANIHDRVAGKYYRLYLKDNNMEHLVSKYSRRYTQDKINQLTRYIVDDKMTIKAASKEANIVYGTGRRHYYQYLKDHNLDVPTRRIITQDQIDALIGYIIDDKMSIRAASKKANMAMASGYRRYHQYLNNQKCDAPIQVVSAHQE